MTETDSTLARFAAVIGKQHVLTRTSETAAYLREWRGQFAGRARAVLRPGSTREVAEVVAICADQGLKVVPQSGNTGLVGGAVPQSDRQQVLLSLSRLNRIRALDAANDSMTVEAGCVLADLQQAAADAGRFFPLSLGAEGSCQIGGNLATNAGGLNVLRYGNARDLVLGLEVVLADGSVWSALRGLRKDNRGYDLKQLFVGSEGTLGIITAAVLKLFPPLRQRYTALLALDDPASGLAVARRLRADSGDNLTACELFPRFAMDIAVRHIEGCRDPFESPQPWYLLVELSSPAGGDWLESALQSALAQALDAGEIRDAVVASSLREAGDFWRIRENIPEAQTREGASIKHDISVAVSRIPELVARASRAVHRAEPALRICAFGHIGDGNLHFNLSQPAGADGAHFMTRQAEFNRMIHDIVDDMDGSFAAEHGIGRLKRDELVQRASSQETGMMHAIKQALDPQGLFNPGAVIADAQSDSS